MNKLKKLIFSIWELPQNIFGFGAKLIFKTTPVAVFSDVTVYKWNGPGGVSLGKYIFVDNPANLNMVKHEYGHRLQSKKLGPIYLLVIGLPSFGWAWFGNGYRKKTGRSYYWFYTEAWADKLGGIERKL